MMYEQYDRINEIVEHALDLPPDQRDVYLEEACVSTAMRVRVDDLIASCESEQTFLDTPVLGLGPSEFQSHSGDSLPTHIGRYRILGKLGQGGMGIVYLAEQREPITRRVAIKVIKLGLDTKEVIARFEAEQQMLAMMDHPGIARVFDAGSTEQGSPYFVMEYVQGKSITAYCDEHTIPTSKRIGLFLKVCDAVQHAHQKGVIHRDLKPSNVLVVESDDEPVPKIIDFGVSKATQQRMTERTLFTAQGQLVGTPEYMSPEQADLDELAIDTRTDIYSLGVLLYELLVGVLPFDPTMLRQAGFAQIQHIIREQDPQRPSTKLSSIRNESSALTKTHAMDFDSLIRSIRGDLDWITMRALEKQRERRYPSASEFASDLRRYLNNEPVLACPPSAAYRAKKFARRNRALVAGFAAVMLAIVIGAVGTGWQAVVATNQRNIAQAAEQHAAQEAAIAQAINDFLNNDLLSAVSPDQQGINVSLRDVLETASERIDDRFVDQPLVEAAVRNTLGETYRSLGEFDMALPHLERSLELRESNLGENDPSTLLSIHNVGTIFERTQKYTEALAYYQRALSGRVDVLGNDHPDTITTRNNLGTLYYSQGKYKEALPIFVASRESLEQLLGSEARRTLIAGHNLAYLYYALGDAENATKTFSEVLAIRRRVFGSEHPDTLATLGGLASAYERANDDDKAFDLRSELVDLQKRVLGERHPSTIMAINNLAVSHHNLGRVDEADQLYQEAVALATEMLGLGHGHTIQIKSNYATFLIINRDPEIAEQFCHDALVDAQESLPDTHLMVGVMQKTYGSVLIKLERFEEAEFHLLEAHRIMVASVGESHRRVRQIMKDIIRLYLAWDRPESVEMWRERYRGLFR